MNHDEHITKREYHADCDDCIQEANGIDWLLAVRKFGIEVANQMFPEG